jgi:hypothetical protein
MLNTAMFGLCAAPCGFGAVLLLLVLPLLLVSKG